LYPLCSSLYFLSWIPHRSFCISHRSFATGATSASFESLCILPRSLCNLQGSPRILLYLLPISPYRSRITLDPSGISVNLPVFPSDLTAFCWISHESSCLCPGFLYILPRSLCNLHGSLQILLSLLPISAYLYRISLDPSGISVDLPVSPPDFTAFCCISHESPNIFNESPSIAPGFLYIFLRSLCNLHGFPQILLSLLPISPYRSRISLDPSGISVDLPAFPNLFKSPPNFPLSSSDLPISSQDLLVSLLHPLVFPILDLLHILLHFP
jgi:hypothetical protein